MEPERADINPSIIMLFIFDGFEAGVWSRMCEQLMRCAFVTYKGDGSPVCEREPGLDLTETTKTDGVIRLQQNEPAADLYL